jgi:hypothetical protein
VSVSAVAAFPHRRGDHCGSCSLAVLAEHHGLGWEAGALTEADVFGIGGGIGLVYCDYDVLGVPFYVLGRSETLESDFCDNAGARLDLRRTDDPQIGAAWLHDEVTAGRPTIVYADIKHLDYLDVQMSNANHAVVVTELDEAAGEAVISDFDRDELERCSLASLAAARASDGFPRPAHHATFVIDFPTRLLPARELESNVASWGGLPADELQALLYRIWFCVARAGTGGALFRSLEADFLARAARVLDDADLAAAASLYGEIAAGWRTVADAVRGDSPERSHRAVRFGLRRVIAQERQGVDALAAWLP